MTGRSPGGAALADAARLCGGPAEGRAGAVPRLAGRGVVVSMMLLTLCSHMACRPPEAAKPLRELDVKHPFEGAVFPPDIAPPTFRWRDRAYNADQWTIVVDFADGAGRLEFNSSSPEWQPADEAWETIKRHSVEQPLRVTIRGWNTAQPETQLSEGTVTFTTSRDEVGAPIFYREVNLPFREAVRDPATYIRWRFGVISSRGQPPTVLSQLPACGNCHSFSADGAVLGMDVDYANDKGSYAICSVDEEIKLDNDHIISWDDFQKDDQRKTFGLLSQVSPDGRYVVSTVKDLSVFRPVDNLTFSQLFFPVRGILCIYDRERETFAALPGADDEQYVQSNAVWSPDGKYIVFARAKALEVPEPRVNELGLTEADEMPDFVKTKQAFRFDLYRIPFNEGRGGQAEPLAGASHNGRSNYFARYSPDGRWIVFCQANSYMLLQPDSELYIIPADGGGARRLECNRELMNSWHSWSPNSRWLVFTSKVFTPYTQLFLAHIDEQGTASPPVLLSWFTAPDMAANIPEFVNTRPDAIHRIRDAFAEDLHHVRKGDQYAMQGREDLALECFRKALEINPQCAEAYRLWGVLLMSQKKLSEAEQHLRKSIELDDHSNYAYWNLAKLMAIQNRNTEALAMFRKAIELNPNYAPIRQDFGSLLLRLGRADEARAQLMTARQVAH